MRYAYPLFGVLVDEIREATQALREVHFICVNLVCNNDTLVLAKEACVNSSIDI